jgi:hypothetical protein
MVANHLETEFVMRNTDETIGKDRARQGELRHRARRRRRRYRRLTLAI